MRILIVGGYGFIGRAVAETLARRDHEIIGWGRSAAIGRRTLPEARWIEGDLGRMTDAAAWRDVLTGIDAVINASGALQDGAGGDLKQVQGHAIVALIDACEAAGIRHFVQISAVGATPDAGTRFMATKAIADAHLRNSSLAWTILRPALVIGRNAYGGTVLIRVLAALPVSLTVHGDSPVQCVALEHVAAACADAVEGVTPPRRNIILAANEQLTLRQVVELHRRWLGLPPAKMSLDLPPTLAVPIVWAADLAGWLGWRSPLRSTAMRVMQDGVIADGEGGTDLAPLAWILAANPSGVQDRIAARLFLLLPLIVLALAALWIGSGIVGLVYSRSAASLLGGGKAAEALVQACSVADLLLGGAILVRRWARSAALLMALVSAFYLVGGSVFTPALWLDPLAPLLKILPALGLALVAAAAGPPMTYHILLWLHVIGATLLLGTGAGIAFFMVMAHRSGDPAVVAHVAGTVVIADFLFTATAVVAQPITGAALMALQGWPLSTPWIALALLLYGAVGLFWVPVVFMQIQMRDLARAAAGRGDPLPPAYHRLYRCWFAFGFPAFFAVLAILWLMVAKPGL